MAIPGKEGVPDLRRVLLYLSMRKTLNPGVESSALNQNIESSSS